MRKIVLILLFPTLSFSQDINTFENGDVADANAVNANFSFLNNKITELQNDLSSLTSRETLDINVDCDNDDAGRGSLQKAISENEMSHSRLVRIFAVGTCSPIEINRGNFQILGGGGLRLNYLGGGTPPGYIMLVGRNARATIVQADLDAAGVNWGIRSYGELNIAFSSVTNAERVHLESLNGGLVQAFGGVRIGDADDTATAAAIVAGGVLANLFIPGIFPPELTEAVLTLNGVNKLLHVRTGGAAALNLQGSNLIATGGAIEIDSAGSLFIGNADVILSNEMSIGTNALMEITENEFFSQGTLSSLQTTLMISQSGSLVIDLATDMQSRVLHYGSLFADLGANISVKGDPSDASKLRLLQRDEQQNPVPLTLMALENSSSALIENAQIAGDVVVNSSSLELGKANVMTAGLSRASVRFGGKMLVGGENIPTGQVNCETGGQSWSTITGSSLCASNN